MKKFYEQSILWIAFLIANCYALKLAFAGMNYQSDLTFFIGLAGLILLVLTDGLMLTRTFMKFLPKEHLL